MQGTSLGSLKMRSCPGTNEPKAPESETSSTKNFPEIRMVRQLSCTSHYTDATQFFQKHKKITEKNDPNHLGLSAVYLNLCGTLSSTNDKRIIALKKGKEEERCNKDSQWCVCVFHHVSKNKKEGKQRVFFFFAMLKLWD